MKACEFTSPAPNPAPQLGRKENRIMECSAKSLAFCDNCRDLTKDKNLIQFFIDAIESKDPYTQGHSHHVRAIAEAIYDCLPAQAQAKTDKNELLSAALLHDIGKIKTPDDILNKNGKLSDGEWEIMARHPKDGVDIIKGAAFGKINDWIMYHHERIDGKGYYGLSGEAIPFEARIIAAADTFSALRTYRVYRPAKSIEEAVEILSEAKGTQLDAFIVNSFLSLNMTMLENLECNCRICRQRRAALQEATTRNPRTSKSQ
jgi:putative nucleotidyltransferase with HDIG domain